MDYPLEELAKTVDGIIARHPTAQAFQKFTCAHCGMRQMMSEPNVFYRSGTCEECGQLTDPITVGNYLLYIPSEL